MWNVTEKDYQNFLKIQVIQSLFCSHMSQQHSQDQIPDSSRRFVAPKGTLTLSCSLDRAVVLSCREERLGRLFSYKGRWVMTENVIEKIKKKQSATWG